jgi:DNA repair protein RecO (recombination protein O)
MQIRAAAIIVAVRSHGEHGAIVRALTEDHGLVAGYVRGGRSRRVRPILSVGNVVAAEFRARSEAQLASLAVEMIASRAPLLSEPLAAAAIEWVTALAAVALPEGHPYPRIYEALDGVLAAVEAAPSARGWVVALERYEALILTALGYGDASAAGLTSNGRRLRDDLLTGRRAEILPARDRLIERIDRAMGR